MKKTILILILFVSLNLHPQQFEVTKQNDSMISQFYLQQDNIIAEDGYVYALSAYGLEIYEIENDGSLSLQSITPIESCASIVLKDEYMYISSGGFSAVIQWGKVYQINVTDKQNPVIEQVLDFFCDVWPLLIFDDALFVKMHDLSNTTQILFFYSLPDLTLLAEHQNVFYCMEKLDDSTALRADGYNQFTVFDFSNPIEPLIIGQGDVSSEHPYNIHRASIFSDSILVCSDMDRVSFWNISNWFNWEFISLYTVPYYIHQFYKPLFNNSQMVLVESDHVELIDLTNIYEPVQIDLLSGTAGPWSITYIDDYNENLYISTIHNGIQWLKLIDNSLSFEGEFFEYTMSYKHQIDNFLFAAVIDYDYKYYDYSNPTDPIEMGTFLTNNNYWLELTLTQNKLAVSIEDLFDYHIFDISNLDNPLLTNEIELQTYHRCRLDCVDESSIYILDIYSNIFKKYDISQPGSNELLFSENLGFAPVDWLIHDQYGYFLEYIDTYQKRLYIYEGLDVNQPEVCTVIDNFVTNPNSFMKIEDGYLSVYTDFADVVLPVNRTRFFDLSNPEQPEFGFSVNAYGEPFIHDGLVFTTSYLVCSVFEKPDIPSGAIEPVFTFSDISNINNVYFIDYNNINYLLLSQASHVGVYSYEYTPADANNVLITRPKTFYNYPNPFNPSTTIEFSIPKDSDVELSIFNIIGQKVKILAKAKYSQGYYSIVWDGDDELGKPVSSGVYLYKLNVNGKNKVTKKCLLLK